MMDVQKYTREKMYSLRSEISVGNFVLACVQMTYPNISHTELKLYTQHVTNCAYVLCSNLSSFSSVNWKQRILTLFEMLSQ
jgi:hypothetical protein